MAKPSRDLLAAFTMGRDKERRRQEWSVVVEVLLSWLGEVASGLGVQESEGSGG